MVTLMMGDSVNDLLFSWTFSFNIAFLQGRRPYKAATNLFVLGMHIFIYFYI